MVRVKRGNVARKRRKKILSLASGYRGAQVWPDPIRRRTGYRTSSAARPSFAIQKSSCPHSK